MYPICFGPGYIGCYDIEADGDDVFPDSEMTVTACREICYGANETLFQYKYAALKGTECHCFIDFHAKSKNIIL